MSVVVFPSANRKSVERVVIDLPLPISANRLWRVASGARVYKGASYARWARDAGYQLLAQRPGCVRGAYHLVLLVARSKRKAHVDLGNYEKGVSDLLQEHGVVQNDSLAESIYSRWTDNASIQGCRAIVLSILSEPDEEIPALVREAESLVPMRTGEVPFNG